MLKRIKKLGHTNKLAVSAAITVGILYAVMCIIAYLAPEHAARLAELPVLSHLHLHVTLVEFIKGLVAHMLVVYLVVALGDKVYHHIHG